MSVPRRAAEAAHQLHAAVPLQVVLGLLGHVPPDLQLLEVVKVRAAQFPEAPRRRAVALPGLRLQQQVLADFRQAAQQPQEALVSVVQVDPHGDGQTQAQVEVGAAVLAQVGAQLLRVAHGVQGDEGDVGGQRVVLLRPLHQPLVQVEAQQVDLPPGRRLIGPLVLHQVFVESHAQLLPFTSGQSTGE